MRTRPCLHRALPPFHPPRRRSTLCAARGRAGRRLESEWVGLPPSVATLLGPCRAVRRSPCPCRSRTRLTTPAAAATLGWWESLGRAAGRAAAARPRIRPPARVLGVGCSKPQGLNLCQTGYVRSDPPSLCKRAGAARVYPVTMNKESESGPKSIVVICLRLQLTPQTSKTRLSLAPHGSRVHGSTPPGPPCTSACARAQLRSVDSYLSFCVTGPLRLHPRTHPPRNIGGVCRPSGRLRADEPGPILKARTLLKPTSNPGLNPPLTHPPAHPPTRPGT